MSGSVKVTTKKLQKLSVDSYRVSCHSINQSLLKGVKCPTEESRNEGKRLGFRQH